MTTFMEQIADPGGWSGYSSSASDSRAGTLAAEGLCDPRVGDGRRTHGNGTLGRLVELKLCLTWRKPGDRRKPVAPTPPAQRPPLMQRNWSGFC